MGEIIQALNKKLENYGIKNASVHWNLSPEKLTEAVLW